MRQAILWTNADLIYWRIYAARGGDELSHYLFIYLFIYCFLIFAFSDGPNILS